MPFALALALGLAVALCGCKKKPSYDVSSPEATLASFGKAVDAGRIPQDLATFISNPREVAAWKLRCRTRGCSGAKFKSVKVDRIADYTATLIADYKIKGNGGAIVMRGKGSRIQFAREEGRWYIEQFGDYVQAPHRRRHAGAERDAGAAPGEAAPSGSGDADGAPATE